MNIFSKVTLQGLKRNRTRTIVTIIGVILSVSLITAVTSSISSLQNYLLRSAIARDGDWHAKYLDVDHSFAEKLENDKKISDTDRIQNVGYAMLDGGENGDKPYLFIAGFSAGAFETVPVILTEGRLPENSGEIIIPEHIKSNGGVEYQIGDTLTLEIGSRAIQGERLNQNNPYSSGEGEDSVPEVFKPEVTKTYKVVGICRRPTFEGYSAPGYTLITKAGSTPGASDSFDVYFRVNNASKIYEYIEKNTGEYGITTNGDYLRALGVSDNDNYNTVLYSLAGILISLIMIGSILLIYNSFSISVSERSRQFGILSSVGATKKQLRKSVLFEGACIGLTGIPIGILVGIGGIGVTLKLVGGLFDTMSTADVPLTLSVSVPALIIAGILGIATILISAYIPARRSAKKSAIDSIRQTQDIKIKAKTVKTSKLTMYLFGLPGVLARKNFKRNKKRYRATVISLFVSIVLFVSASAFGLYLKQGTEMSFETDDYDITLGSADMTEEEGLRLYEKLKTADDVTESGYHLNTIFTAKVPVGALSERYKEFALVNDEDADTVFDMDFEIIFIDDAAYLNYLRELGLSAAEYTTGENLPAVAKVQGYDNSTQRVISLDMFGENETISLQAVTPLKRTNNETETVAGDQPDATSKNIRISLAEKAPTGFSRNYILMVFAPFSAKDNFVLPESSDSYLSLIFRSDDPMKSAEDMESILDETGISPSTYMLYNAAEVQAANRNILFIINVFTYGFIILMSLITIANVFNTISTNISLRRREFAMLRSVGMTDRGFNAMMNYECIFYGIKSLLYGLPVSAAVTWLIYHGVTAGVDLPFTLPWASIGISICSVFFVVFITMLYAIGKIKKENTVDALKSDMI